MVKHTQTFGHFVGLALKELKSITKILKQLHTVEKGVQKFDKISIFLNFTLFGFHNGAHEPIIILKL